MSEEPELCPLCNGIVECADKPHVHISHWWCPNCACDKDPHQVIDLERCFDCHKPVVWIDNPEYMYKPSDDTRYDEMDVLRATNATLLENQTYLIKLLKTQAYLIKANDSLSSSLVEQEGANETLWDENASLKTLIGEMTEVCEKSHQFIQRAQDTYVILGDDVFDLKKDLFCVIAKAKEETSK
jgi:hypothetical protein